MNDPNLEPVKLIDFDLETLSEVAELIKRDLHIVLISEEEYPRRDRLLQFRTQVLNAFSRVKSEQKVMNQ